MDSAFGTDKVGDLVLVFHVGTEVVDPPLFPTRIVRLNLYFWASEEEEEEEFPRFLILPCSLLFASIYSAVEDPMAV